MMILEESQRQGWVLKKKLLKCHKLQGKLQWRQVRWLLEKLKEAQLEMEVFICELDQGEFLGEKEGIFDEFLNC